MSAPVPVRVYLCACGPILAEALALDQLEETVGLGPGVTVVRHATLCSEEGRRWMADDLATLGEARVVVAGCSTREHGETFQKVMRQAGVNPYLLGMAAIREQAAWVTPDRGEATGKALDLVRAAVERVRHQVALETRTAPANTDVLVVGAGVAGLTAAKLLAEADRRVVLVERLPAIGGQVARLGEIYPGDECASCVLEPLMDEVLHHDGVEILTASEVTEVLGFLGNFQVSIRQLAPQVDPAACYGCHTCHEACPVVVPREADEGLSTRKAIYVPYTGAVPNVSSIDPSSCLRPGGGDCDACAGACPFGAIQLDRLPVTLTREVGAVVLATGAAQILPPAWQGQPRVVSAAGLERLLSDAGPTGGKVALPGREPPRSVAILHGVDESGLAPAPTPSALDALLAQKYLHELRLKLPDAKLHEVVFQTGSEALSAPTPAAADVHGAPAKGILRQHRLGQGDRFIGFDDRVGRGALRFTVRGYEVTVPVDLVVVLSPITGAATVADLATQLNLDRDAAGFLTPDHPQLRPFRSRVDGVYLAGAAAGPTTMALAAGAGAAAAAGALSALVPGRELTLSPVTATVLAELCGGCHSCTLACPFRAVQMDEDTGKAVVAQTLCRGCGCCAAGCPSSAITAHHYADEQLEAELDALLAGPRAAPASQNTQPETIKGS